jgi:mono/diheme cytochrome c family protein
MLIGLTTVQARKGASKATEKVGKRPKLNAQRSMLNSERASWALSVGRWTLGIFPHLRQVGLASVLLLLFAGCTNTTPPVVTPELAAGKNPDRTVAMAKLQHGRILFASRCIECHTLPPVNAHDATEWPRLVGWMAKRASLKPEEREAMIAYLVAARAQKTDSK